MVAHALLLAICLLLVTSPAAAAEIVYDFEWRSLSRLSRAQGGNTITTGGEMTGRATLWLTPGPGDAASFTWSGPEGTGRGTIAGTAIVDMIFPTTIFPAGAPVDVPPAPAHLVGGSYEPVGDPHAPRAFDIRYVDGFLCRAEPTLCDHVNRWERHFEGRAVRRDAVSATQDEGRTAGMRRQPAPSSPPGSARPR